MPPAEISSFTPRELIHRLEAEPDGAPARALFNAATLMVDVMGSTALADRLMSRAGAAGADQVTRILNGYFNPIIALITQGGGHVATFIGDGLIAYWPAADDAQSLAQATRAAVRCALEQVQAVKALEHVEGERLAVRLAVGSGPVFVTRLGGHKGRWDASLAGEGIEQLKAPMKLADSNELLLHAQAAAQVGAAADGDVLDGGHLRMRSLAGSSAAPPSHPVASDPELLARYLPTVVRQRVSAGLNSWLAELRMVTPMFVGLPELKRWPEHLELLHKAVGVIQAAVSRWHGSFDKVTVDDKGTFTIAEFGVATGAGREYRASDAVLCGLEIEADLTALGVRCSIGLATGKLFCGPLGSDERRDYTVIGSAANLAARLMKYGQQGVYCDGATQLSARSQVAFQTPTHATLKGFSEPVPVSKADARLERAVHQQHGQLRGREDELQALDQLLEDLERGQDGALAFEGEAGTGKSALAAEGRRRAERKGLLCLVVEGESGLSTHPYRAWRQAIEALVGSYSLGQEASLAPLLNPILGTSLPDNANTRGLSGGARAQAVNALLSGILQRVTETRGLLLVVEDGQWLDSASLQLLIALTETVSPLSLVLTTRAPTPQSQAEYRLLLDRTERMVLRPLQQDELDALLCDTLEVSHLPRNLVKWVLQHGAGNPAFSLELALSLVARGLLEVDRGRVTRSPDRQALEALTPPATVEGAVAHRIDRLAEADQVVLKAASVLGMSFELTALKALEPVGSGLGERMESLTRSGICVKAAGPVPRYSFSQRPMKEVAYGMLVRSKRVRLHGLAAVFYEGLNDRGSRAPVLAHHWSQTNAYERAINYLESSWQSAEQAGAVLEAYGFMRTAVELDERRSQDGQPPADGAQRAAWQRRLSDGATALGRPPQALEHAELALIELGSGVPTSSKDWSKLLRGELLAQLWHRMAPAALWRASGADAQRVSETARAFDRLSECYFYMPGDQKAFMASIFAAINRAEQADADGVACNSWGTASMLFGMLRLPRVAGYYLGRCVRGAERLGESRAVVSGMYFQLTNHAIHGRWDAFEALRDELLPKLQLTRTTFMLSPLLTVLVFLDLVRADYARARERNLELARVAAVQTIERSHGWVANNLAEIALHTGDHEEALKQALLAEDILDREGDLTALRAKGVRVTALARQEQHEQAEQAAAELIALLEKAPFTSFTRIEAYAGPMEARMLAIEQLQDQRKPASQELIKGAQEALDQLERYSKRFNYGRPRFHLLQGCLLTARGDVAAARKALDEADDWARRMRDRCVTGRVSEARARLESAGSDRQTELAAQAIELYESLGARWLSRRVRRRFNAQLPTFMDALEESA